MELGRPLFSALLLGVLVLGVTKALFFIRLVRTKGAEPNITKQEHLITAEGRTQL